MTPIPSMKEIPNQCQIIFIKSNAKIKYSLIEDRKRIASICSYQLNTLLLYARTTGTSSPKNIIETKETELVKAEYNFRTESKYHCVLMCVYIFLKRSIILFSNKRLKKINSWKGLRFKQLGMKYIPLSQGLSQQKLHKEQLI